MCGGIRKGKREDVGVDGGILRCSTNFSRACFANSKIRGSPVQPSLELLNLGLARKLIFGVTAS